MDFRTVGFIALYCVLFTFTVLLNSRIYWLVKEKKDPIEALKPWWEKNEDDKKINDEFVGRG